MRIKRFWLDEDKRIVQVALYRDEHLVISGVIDLLRNQVVEFEDHTADTDEHSQIPANGNSNDLLLRHAHDFGAVYEVGIRWHQSDYKQDVTVFDSLWEAEEWADSIRQDMMLGLYDGYSTPDKKVAQALAHRLAESSFHGSAYNHPYVVKARSLWEDNQTLHKVWMVKLPQTT